MVYRLRIETLSKIILSGTLFVLILLLTACGTESEKEVSESKSEKNVNVEEKVSQEISDSGEYTEEQTGLTLENDGVDDTEYKEILSELPKGTPEKLITTSVPISEMMDLLGLTPIGVPTSTNPLPENFQNIDEIGSPMAPDLELMTNLAPDLVIGAESLRSSLDESMGSIELPTAYLPTDSFDDLKISFKVLGTYFDKTDEMNAKMQSILDKENELTQLTEGEDLPSVMLMMGTSDSFMVMNDSSYLGSLIDRLGAENIASTVLDAPETYSPMNMEEVVVADPDLILVLASGDHGASEEMFQEEIDNNDLWSSLSAYQEDNIHILDYETFGVTSINNVETALSEITAYFVE